MKMKIHAVTLTLTALAAALAAGGCSHAPSNAAAGTSQPAPIQSASAAAFNPTVTPPPATAADNPCYSFQQTPAPVPPATPAVTKESHRYLHVVYRNKYCYLVDRYGHYYDSGRTNTGEIYPVYQDPVTDAVYPLYYDDRRDNYYRCVDNTSENGVPSGYYRNYIGDSADEFYEGDPNQEEECQSNDSQAFVVNYNSDDSGYNYYRHHHWHGFDPSYGYWSGPNYNEDQVSPYVPLIVAAFIVFDSNNDNGSGDDYGNGGNYGRGGYDDGNQVIVNNHYYYQRNVTINNFNNHSTNARFVALPGPPLGHFGGYRGRPISGGNRTASGGRGRALPPVVLPGSRNLYHPSGRNNQRAGAERTASSAGGRPAAFGGGRLQNPGPFAHVNGRKPTNRNFQHAVHTAGIAAAGVAGAVAVHHMMKSAAHHGNVNATRNGAERSHSTTGHAAAVRHTPSVTHAGTRQHMSNMSHSGARPAAARTEEHRSSAQGAARNERPAYHAAARSTTTYQRPRAAETRHAAPTEERHDTAPRQEEHHSAPREVEHYSAPRPVEHYSAPAEHYQAPREEERPVEHYSAPVEHNQAPQQHFQAPRQSFQAPRDGGGGRPSGGGGGRPSGGGGGGHGGGGRHH